MSELRCEIDDLDVALVALLKERSTYIDRAIHLKTKENLPARLSDRVEQVVQNVRLLAQQQDFDPALAETLWREIIEWSILRESKVLGA